MITKKKVSKEQLQEMKVNSDLVHCGTNTETGTKYYASCRDLERYADNWKHSYCEYYTEEV